VGDEDVGDSIRVVPIEEIGLGDRVRKDLGDIAELAETMKLTKWQSPIVVTSDLKLVAGLRRLKALEKQGAKEVSVQVLDSPDLAWIVEGMENIARKQLTAYEEASFRVRFDEWMRSKLGDAEQSRNVKGGMARQGQPVLNISKGWNQKRTAATLGVSQQSISQDQKIVEWGQKKESIRTMKRGKALQTIRRLEKLELWAKGFDEATHPWRRHNLWTFPSEPELWGTLGYPGAIPGELILHIVHFYSKPNDLVVDPMVGGCSTVQVCRLLKRQYVCSDLHPELAREDLQSEIKKWDITNGFPEEAKNCDLIILDPPYWRRGQVSERYPSDCVSQLALPDFVAFLSKLAKDSFDTVKPNGHVALLMQPYLSGQEIIDLSIIATNLFLQAGFKEKMRFTCPLEYFAKHGADYEKFDATGEFVNLIRDLVIFQK